MNEKKYEITNIAHPQYPWLHRIRALRDMREDVHAGDLGGFVQSEENLSQEGQCWIAGNAIVAEEAYVYGEMCIRDRYNTVQKGTITVHKEGEVFSHVTEAGGLYQPQYEVQGQPGAVYDITALEDIVTPDAVSYTHLDVYKRQIQEVPCSLKLPG